MRRYFASLQKSRQNNRSYVWTETLSGFVRYSRLRKSYSVKCERRVNQNAPITSFINCDLYFNHDSGHLSRTNPFPPNSNLMGEQQSQLIRVRLPCINLSIPTFFTRVPAEGERQLKFIRHMTPVLTGTAFTRFSIQVTPGYVKSSN